MANRPSTSDPKHDSAISREDTDDEEQGSEDVGKREKESDESEIEEQGRPGDWEQDDVQAAARPTFANAPTGFGRKRSNFTVQKENDSYDYEQKYPEDVPYEETAPAARVWRTYQDESRSHDTNMVEEFRDNVDVLLVFAGLFSAVVTTFVVQTSQNLQADYAAISASLLYESILVQRAIANGSSVNAIASSTFNPTTPFVPATIDVWVNGLWFTSLFLSLTTALVAVLVKQWLHHYVALPSGTPRDCSFIRQYRYSGFQKWHVQTIIGLLPVLMHLALALFFVGLVAFLIPLRETLSWIICAGTILVYGAYTVAAVLPIIYPQCPYRTPLCNLTYAAFGHAVPRVSWSLWRKDAFVDALIRRSVSGMLRYLPHVHTRNTRSLTMIESDSVSQMSTKLAAEALNWLFSVSSNPTIQSIVIQSIGGLPMASEREFFKFKSHADRKMMEDMQRALLGSCLQPDEEHPQYDRPIPGMELKTGRLLRFDAHFNGVFMLNRYIVVPDADSFELIPTVKSSYFRHIAEKPADIADNPAGFSAVAAFFKHLICAESSLTLPLLRWSHLLGCARHAGSFSPSDPETDEHTDSFPIALCSALINSFAKSMEHPIQDLSSPVVLRFEDAVPYIHEEVYDNVLRMLSGFTNYPLSHQLYESLSKPLRMLIVAMEFLLYRLTLPESGNFHTIIRGLLITAVKQLDGEVFSFQDATALIMVLEDVLPTCVILDRDKPNADELCYHTTLAYQHSITISPSACSLNGLQSMVDLMTASWERKSGYQWYQFDIPCRVLAHLLANHFPAAYAVFLDKQCLEIFGNHRLHEASFQVIKEYVAGISAMDGATLRQHVEYLYEPCNLFTACCILAMHGFKDTDQAAIRSDITTLVRLCPRDAAWEECRRKLHGLMGNDDNDFSNSQRRFDHGLQRDEYQIGKDNIRYAIDVLNAFFDGAYLPVPFGSPSAPIGHLDRLKRILGKCIGRMPEINSSEQLQQA